MAYRHLNLVIWKNGFVVLCFRPTGLKNAPAEIFAKFIALFWETGKGKILKSSFLDRSFNVYFIQLAFIMNLTWKFRQQTLYITSTYEQSLTSTLHSVFLQYALAKSICVVENKMICTTYTFKILCKNTLKLWKISTLANRFTKPAQYISAHSSNLSQKRDYSGAIIAIF